MNSQITTTSSHTKQLVTMSLMTAVLCILAPLSIPIPVSPVPISLTNLVLYIGIYILGTHRLLGSYIVYLLLGICGLPVFSGFSGGLGKLAGPTGGYLAGFLFLILISGFFMSRSEGRFRLALQAFGLILGSAAMYLFGTMWLCFQMHLSFVDGLFVGVIPYLPGDTVKIVLALIIGPLLQKRLARFLIQQ